MQCNHNQHKCCFIPKIDDEFYIKEESDTIFQLQPGDIYTTSLNERPESLLGYGEWNQIDAFLEGVDSGAGNYIGSDLFTITVDTMPSHSHDGSGMVSSHFHQEASHTHNYSLEGKHDHTFINASIIYSAEGNDISALSPDKSSSPSVIEGFNLTNRTEYLVNTFSEMQHGTTSKSISDPITGTTKNHGQGEEVKFMPYSKGIFYWLRIK